MGCGVKYFNIGFKISDHNNNGMQVDSAQVEGKVCLFVRLTWNSKAFRPFIAILARHEPN